MSSIVPGALKEHKIVAMDFYLSEQMRCTQIKLKIEVYGSSYNTAILIIVTEVQTIWSGMMGWSKGIKWPKEERGIPHQGEKDRTRLKALW